MNYSKIPIEDSMTSTLIAPNELVMIAINIVNTKCVDNDGTLKMK